MQISLSEMVYARFLTKGDRVEATRLRRPENERFFGVQIATNQIDEGINAMKMAKAAGADFVDLNCGCPIYEATRRGLGSSLLRSPKNLERLVQGIIDGSSDNALPLSVKIRLGCSEDTINCRDVVNKMRNVGAAAVTIHARTARQGYRRPADWQMIKQVVEDGLCRNSAMPIIGNGDIMTHYEATQRMKDSKVNACMVGRGALIKPWIFQEFQDGREWEPSLEDRIEIYYTLTAYMKEYFGSDSLGKSKSWKFLPWHFSFLNRFKAYPEDEYKEESLVSPLIHRRIDIPDDAPPLQILLSHRSEDTHELIAEAFWNSDSSADALQKLQRVAEGQEFRDIQTKCLHEDEVMSLDTAETTELANIPSIGAKKGESKRRHRRSQKPDRTPEEIAAIRAERAAKKARLEAEQAGLEQQSQ
jgi:tRNA-dihydrouridine synthase 3